MLNLNEKTALITGATGGIGRAIAKTLYAQGANLILTDMDQGKLDAFTQELGERAHALAVNITDKEAPKSLLKFSEPFGGIDILINNAGITKDTLSMRMTDEMWDNHIQWIAFIILPSSLIWSSLPSLIPLSAIHFSDTSILFPSSRISIA